MNDYFLKILTRQRHAEIFAEVRAARLSKMGRTSEIPGNKSLRRLRSLFSKRKSSVTFKPPGAVERRTS